jgi:hypothetical protein
VRPADELLSLRAVKVLVMKTDLENVLSHLSHGYRSATGAGGELATGCWTSDGPCDGTEMLFGCGWAC